MYFFEFVLFDWFPLCKLTQMKGAWSYGEKNRWPFDYLHYILDASSTHKELRKTKDEIRGRLR